MKIFTDKKVFKSYLWRGMVSTCPHCKKEPPEAYRVWNRKEWVDGVYLKEDMPQFKTDSVAMFSVCQLCQKNLGFIFESRIDFILTIKRINGPRKYKRLFLRNDRGVFEFN